MWRRVVVLVAVLVVAAGGAWVVLDDDPDPVPSLDDALGYDEPDLVNPMRGQFDNILTGLFPQSNPDQSARPGWPGTRDAAIRLTWRQLEPTARGAYDFSLLDRALDEYGARGMRVDLRVSTYDSCCEQLPAGSRNLAVPDWLAALPGTVELIDRDGVTQVVPRWNDDTYLAAFSDLLAELGRRYDRDERLSVFEMSGYGDFGENTVPVMRDELGRPGPAAEDSEAELGYYSQYSDHFITQASAERLVDANLRAFPRTQVVASVANPAITKLLLRDSPALAGVAHPVGVRADCLGVFGVRPTWATNAYSEYVKRDDPIIDVLTQRLVQAPVITEWCQKPDDVSADDYYRQALSTIIGEHVSMTASSGFPDQLSDQPMTDDHYELWRRANVFAGYRYAARATVESQGAGVTASVDWTNLGVAPTHERWTVVYGLRSSDGELPVRESRLDLSTLSVDQDADAGEPAAASAKDVVGWDSVAPGEYELTVEVRWADHKADGTHRYAPGPMRLSLPDRLDDGSYRLGTVRVG